MKKLALLVAGAMMALSLAACAPTDVSDKGKPQAAQTNPAGVNPEMIQKEKETQIDPKLLVDPDAPVLETVMIYYANEDGTGLVYDLASAEEVTADVVVEALIEYGVLEEGTTVNGYEIAGGEKAGPGVEASVSESWERIGTLDLSALEEDADKAVVYAIGNTFCENFELDKLELLVNGEAYESSLITDGYLYFEEKYKEFK